MKTFNYTAMNAMGIKVCASIQATSEDAAQSEIRSFGYFVISIKEASPVNTVREMFSKQWQFSIFNYKFTIAVESNE